MLRSDPVKAVIGDTFDFDGGKLMVPRIIPEQVFVLASARLKRL